MALTLFQAVRLFAAIVERELASSAPLARPLRLDINEARPAELALLPGIGRGRAEAILLHRVRHGPFRRIQDLEAVDGLGAATVAGLMPYIRLRDAE